MSTYGAHDFHDILGVADTPELAMAIALDEIALCGADTEHLGAIQVAEMTPALVKQCGAFGGSRRFRVLPDGRLCTIAEASALTLADRLAWSRSGYAAPPPQTNVRWIRPYFSLFAGDAA